MMGNELNKLIKLDDSNFRPEDGRHEKITTEILRDYIAQVARLVEADKFEICEDAEPSEVSGIFIPKKWKRFEKSKIDESMRETLREKLPDLPNEDIYARYFRYETESISWLLGETYSTEDRVLLVSVEDQ